METIKHLDLFAGIGAFAKALKNLGIPTELAGYSDIDKFASRSYAAVHSVSENYNFGDITKIPNGFFPKDIDLITYGFPCQDISVAGKQKGFEDTDGNRTRSGLFFEALRIIEDVKPKYAIAENVKNLTGKKFKAEFEIVLSSLEEAGYNNYWKVLNAKDYGIPQNRERVFIVSIRKDIDDGTFKFPEPIPLQLRLKDMLEDEVDEKYYLSNEAVAKINIKSDKDVSNTIRAGGHASLDRHSWDLVQVGQLKDTKSFGGNPQTGRVYSADGISPTLSTMQGGQREPKVVVGAAMRGRNPDNPSDRTTGIPTEQRIEINGKEISNTITSVQKDALIAEVVTE